MADRIRVTSDILGSLSSGELLVSLGGGRKLARFGHLARSNQARIPSARRSGTPEQRARLGTSGDHAGAGKAAALVHSSRCRLHPCNGRKQRGTGAPIAKVCVLLAAKPYGLMPALPRLPPRQDESVSVE